MVLALTLVACAGCVNLNREFVKTVDNAWTTIGPEYDAYVRNDPNITAAEKEVRLLNSASFTQLINEAVVEVE